MPFTDEQFKKFMEVLDMREMLIRIDENTKNFHLLFNDHKAVDASEFAIQRQSIAKAHERVDVVSDQVKQFKWMLAGGCILISTVVFVANFYFSIRGH